MTEVVRRQTFQSGKDTRLFEEDANKTCLLCRESYFQRLLSSNFTLLLLHPISYFSVSLKWSDPTHVLHIIKKSYLQSNPPAEDTFGVSPHSAP